MKDKKSPRRSVSAADRKAAAEDLSFFAYLRRRNRHIFAHHPPGPAFRDHVWEYKGLFFCKGCVMTFLGIGLGMLLYATTGWLRGLSAVATGLIFWALLLPVVLTSLLEAPRALKHLARVLLGVVVISAAIMLFVTPSWLVRISIAFTYFLVLIPLSRRRRLLNQALQNRPGRRS